jgi:MoaA/NifB/PqqE/SkfB family radical SAM enzyme
MKIIKKIKTIIKIFFSRLGLYDKPVAMRWNITNQCNNQCTYCCCHKIKNQKELNESEILDTIEKIKCLGIERLSLSGGEPLMSPYFGLIVEKCSDYGISLIMNSSGYNIENHINHIKKLDLIQFSCDGDADVIAKISCVETSDVLEKAINIAKANKVKFTFCATLTKYNTNIVCVEYLLKKAKKYNTMVAFQPIKEMSLNKDSYLQAKPEENEYRKVVAYLLSQKKQGDSSIRNSVRGLEHIYHWPKYKNLFCTASKLFCVLQADGTMVPCDRTVNEVTQVNIIDNNSIMDSLSKLSFPVCEGCGFCGALELNFLYGLDFSIINTVNKLVK